MIAAKAEEVRGLRALVASKHQDNEILADQIKSMEEHLNKAQRRRVLYEKRITVLEEEIQSLKSVPKRYIFLNSQKKVFISTLIKLI